jgi:hypothetical protein
MPSASTGGSYVASSMSAPPFLRDEGPRVSPQPLPTHRAATRSLSDQREPTLCFAFACPRERLISAAGQIPSKRFPCLPAHLPAVPIRRVSMLFRSTHFRCPASRSLSSPLLRVAKPFPCRSFPVGSLSCRFRASRCSASPQLTSAGPFPRTAVPSFAAALRCFANSATLCRCFAAQFASCALRLFALPSHVATVLILSTALPSISPAAPRSSLRGTSLQFPRSAVLFRSYALLSEAVLRLAFPWRCCAKLFFSSPLPVRSIRFPCMSARCCSPARRCLANLGSAFPVRISSLPR